MYDSVAKRDKTVKSGTFYKDQDIPEDFNSEIFGCGNPVKYMTESDETGVLLDLGCGAGIDIYYASKKIKKAFFVGLDFSHEMLKRAKENCEKAGIEAVFVQADIKNLPFKDDVVDILVSNACIHLVQNKEDVFKEIDRTGKENLQMYVSDIAIKKQWKDEFFNKEYKKTGGIFLYGGLDTQDIYLEKLKNSNLKYNLIKEEYFNPSIEIIPMIKGKYRDISEKVIDELKENIFVLVDYLAYKKEQSDIPVNVSCKCGKENVFRFIPRIVYKSTEFDRLINNEINIIKCECGNVISAEDTFMILYSGKKIDVKFPEKWLDYKEMMEEGTKELRKGYKVNTYYKDNEFIEKLKKEEITGIKGFFKRIFRKGN